jgi:hypothetical protein
MRVVAACILVLKFVLNSRALIKDRMLFFENITSSPLRLGFSKILASATHEFQANLGHLESRFSRMIPSKVSKDSF